VGDICSLRSVSEAAVLETLRVRFARDEIYTAVCQGILLAVNPARDVSSVYSTEVQDQYAGATDVSALPPHVYRVAQAALLNLHLPDAKDQAVLISGESGAGKTESTKHILSFLVGPACRTDGGGHIFQKALSANIVLEAFGNATTTQNSNSSRFAKWLDIRASHAGARLQVHGCQLTHYLLETARVCGHAPGERNFHILYQLLQAPAELLAELRLEADSASYAYLRPSGSEQFQPNHGDWLQTLDTGASGSCVFGRNPEVESVRQALAIFRVEPSLEKEIFRILAGILHLGNCEFETVDDVCQLVAEGPARCAAELLGVAPESLMDCLLTVRRQIRHEETKSPTTPAQARSMRDGLAQLLYGHLFNWLLRRMNRELLQAVELAPPEGFESHSSVRVRSLGILDIAGFERFERNSLEQLLINLSNEYLQQSFNLHVFKSEQRDCLSEGIAVDTINFSDNQDCLDLIAGAHGGGAAERILRPKAPGILDLLDEEAAVPRATEERFVAKITATFAPNSGTSRGGHARFVKPRFAESSFTVKHFAGVVKYDCEGWLQKNSGKPPAQAVQLVAGSQLQLVQDAAASEVTVKMTPRSAPSAIREEAAKDLGLSLEPTEGAQQSRRGRRAQSSSHLFRVSLRALMERINASNISFIRCIKPKANLQDVSRVLHAPKVLQQLHAGGILEAIRIRQRGYSSRWPFAEFMQRYGCLARAAGVDTATTGRALTLRELVGGLLRLLSHRGHDDSNTQVIILGKSKVLAKAAAAHFLEVQRARVFEDFATLVQRSARTLLSRQQLVTLAKAHWEVQQKARSCPSSPRRQLLSHELPLESGSQPASSSSSAPRVSPRMVQDVNFQTPRGACLVSAKSASFQSAATVVRSPEVSAAKVEAHSHEELADCKERFAMRRAMFERAATPKDECKRMPRATSVRQSEPRRGRFSNVSGALVRQRVLFESSSKDSPSKPSPRKHRGSEPKESQPTWKVKILEALSEAIANRELPALVAAIKRAEQAHLTEAQLRDARAALLEIRRAAAPSLLEEALRSQDISQLSRAISEGEAAGLEEQLLLQARLTLTRLQADEALHHATEELEKSEAFPSALVEKRKMAALQAALEQGRIAGASDESFDAGRRALETAQARIDLREALRTTDLLTVKEALQRGIAAGLEGPLVHDALRATLEMASEEAAQSGDSEMLQVAIEQAEAMGPVSPLTALHEAIAQASRTLARLWMNSRDPGVLQTAMEMGRMAGLSAEELANAMRMRMQLIAEASAAAAGTAGLEASVERSGLECAICFEAQAPTSVMPCCGREGSSLRVCTECLIRMGTCPFCRTSL